MPCGADDDELDRVAPRGEGAGAALGVGAELRTPPSPDDRVGAGAALGAGVGAGAALPTRPSPEVLAGAGADAALCADAALGAGVGAGVDRRMPPIAAPDERVVDRVDVEGAGVGARVGGAARDGLTPRSCDGVVVVVGTGRVRDGADPSVAVADRSTRPPMAGSPRRSDVLWDRVAPAALTDGAAPRLVVPAIAVVVVVARVPCRPSPPAAARVLVAAPRVVEIFGWLSTVAVRVDRTALSRPSIVSVRGRSPRRGRGSQTFE